MCRKVRCRRYLRQRTTDNKKPDCMKKKLNLFCILIFVVLVCDILSMSNSFVAGLSSGMQHALDKKNITESKQYNFGNIALLPTELSQDNIQTMTDRATGERRQAWPTQLIVAKEKPDGIVVIVFKMFYTLLFGVLSVAALVSFVLFVRNVNKNRIFMRANIRLLRLMGWCLVAAGAITTLDGCYDTYQLQQAFRLDGYIVDYGAAANFSGIIFGFFSLVMAEAFAIGFRMKEEQELTI